MDFINDNPDKDWEWDCISQNPGITMIDINDHPELPWNWFWISSNPNITMKDNNNN